MILAAIVLALAALSCGDEAPETAPGAKVTHAGGEGCPLGPGNCAGKAGQVSLLTFELSPPGADARQYITDIPFPTGGALGFKFRETSSLCGTIVQGFSTKTGTVFAMPDPQPIAGQPQSYQAAVTTENQFCMTVPFGRYALESYPDTTNTPSDLPPLRRFVEVDAAHKQFDVEYPADSAMTQVVGVVLADSTGIGDIAVKAADRSTGIESNTFRTTWLDAVYPDGAFFLNIPATSGTYSIILAPTADNPDWPTVEYPGFIPTSSTADLGNITFGDIPPTVTVSGKVGNLPPGAVGAQVSFRASIGNGVFTKTIRTAPDGTFQTILRAAAYGVTVVPPITAGAVGITAFKDVAVDQSRTLDLALDRKKQMQGTVTYPDLVPGDGVTVSAQRLGSCDPEEGGTSLPPIETTAGADGTYRLAVDAGLYEIALVPPQGVNNARAVRRGVCVSADTTLDVTLPRTALVTGAVADAAGNPAASTSFNVYLNYADMSGKAVLVGAGVTDAAGRFTVPLPDVAGR